MKIFFNYNQTKEIVKRKTTATLLYQDGGFWLSNFA